MANYERLIEALQALTPEEAAKVSELIRYDSSVPELILSLEIAEVLNNAD